MFRALVISISLLISSSWALQAQITLLRALSVQELIDLCSNTATSKEVKSGVASELTLRDSIKLDEVQLKIALECLQSEFGGEFKYNGFSLFSPELDAAAADANRVERESSEQVAQTRVDAFSEELNRICYAELESDRFRAMTTNACAQIFIRDGLPE